MRKAKGIFICCLFPALFLFYLSLVFAADETLTITTYYPSPYGSYNQFKVASNTWLAYSSGSVGIGTTGPSVPLHVVSGSDASFRLQKTGANASYLTINVADNVTFDNSFTAGTELNLRYDGKVCVGVVDCQSKLGVYGNASIGTTYVTSAAPTNGLIVEGNVGIGITSPARALEVYGDSGATILRIRAAATPGTKTYNGSIYFSTDGPAIASDIAAIRQFDDSDTYGLDFQTYSGGLSTKMTILGGGNVGIGTTSPAAKLDVAGGIKSTMWQVTQLLNSTAGPLPLTSASFSTGGGTLLIFASGEGYAVSSQQIGMSIAVDGVIKGYAKTYTNEVSSHKAFTSNALVVTGIAAGSHTIGLASWNSTSTDTNDFFNVTVLELPF